MPVDFTTASSLLRRHWKLATFLSLVVVMAAVYNLLWVVRPDYFRIQQDVNFLPIELMQLARDENIFSEGQASKDFSVPDESKVVAQIKLALAEASASSANVASKRAELAAVSKKIDDGQAAFSQSQFNQFEEYVKKQVAPLEAAEKAKAEQMETILRSNSVSDVDQLQPQERIAHANLNIERSELALRAAKAKVDAYDFGLRNLVLFQNTPEQKAFIELLAQQRAIQKEFSALQDQRVSQNGKFYELLIEYRRQTLPKLTFADFLYFSVGAATTATFGDIAPNFWIVRLLTALQVLVSVILMGLALNDLGNRDRVATNNNR